MKFQFAGILASLVLLAGLGGQASAATQDVAIIPVPTAISASLKAGPQAFRTTALSLTGAVAAEIQILISQIDPQGFLARTYLQGDSRPGYNEKIVFEVQRDHLVIALFGKHTVSQIAPLPELNSDEVYFSANEVVFTGAAAAVLYEGWLNLSVSDRESLKHVKCETVLLTSNGESTGTQFHGCRLN